MIYWIVGISVGLLLLILATSAVCFYIVFYSKSRRVLGEDEFIIPQGKIYESYQPDILRWVKAMRSNPHETFAIRSHDGLRLQGLYYEYKKGAPVEILFHGYRSNIEHDLCGAIDKFMK